MAGETLMGRSLDQARGTPLAELFSGLVESQWSILQDAVQKAVQTGIGADLSTQNIIIPAANGVPARRAQGVAPMGPSKEDITGAVLIFRGVGQSDPAAQGSCAQHSSVGNLSPLEEKGRDELTGLLSRADAENALRSAIEHATHRFLAAFVLDRFDPIRHRFGIRAAQEVLLFYSIHLAQSMGPTDLLFHWSGPSFLMLLDRSAPATEVRREISAWAGVRLEKVVEATAHQAMLLISGKWRLFEALESVSPPRLIDEVDAFATGGQ
jgi:GGDEF domain-containing protein